MPARVARAGLKLLATALALRRGHRPDRARLIIAANTLLLAIIVALYLMRGRPLLP
jgi:hypothetical protein